MQRPFTVAAVGLEPRGGAMDSHSVAGPRYRFAVSHMFHDNHIKTRTVRFIEFVDSCRDTFRSYLQLHGGELVLFTELQ